MLCFRCTVSDVNSDETRWGSKDLEGWNPTENLHSLYSNSPYPCCSAQYRLSKDLEGWNSKHVPLLQHMTPAWASPMRPGNGSWKETDRRPDAQADAFPVSNLISENPQTIPTRRCDPTWGNTSLYFSLLLATVLLGRVRLALAGRPCRRAGAGREGMYKKLWLQACVRPSQMLSDYRCPWTARGRTADVRSRLG